MFGQLDDAAPRAVAGSIGPTVGDAALARLDEVERHVREIDPAPGEQPVLELDGAVLPLPAPSREASSAGLTKSPYRIPTPWSAMFYYKVDETVVARLGNAGQLSIRITENTKDGTARTLFASKVTDSRLKDFAGR